MNGILAFTIEINFSLLAAAALCLLPLVFVILRIQRVHKERRAESKAPFKELRRRPAGEALRMKIAVLDEEINDRIFLLLAMPAGMVMAMFIVKPFNFFGSLILVAVSLIWTLAFKGKLSKSLEERRKCQLGYDGERFVGEELSRLIGAGFEIYHDVPFDGFNMDHVLVGNPGVFVVETKTKSKPVDESGSKKFEVVFDGRRLHWPWGPESRDIEQARYNAKTLSEWLTSAVGEVVGVSPIVTFPGWWVERKAPYDGVYVLNPKEIIQVCDSSEFKLNEMRIRQICHHLDTKCRVEIK